MSNQNSHKNNQQDSLNNAFQNLSGYFGGAGAQTMPLDFSNPGALVPYSTMGLSPTMPQMQNVFPQPMLNQQVGQAQALQMQMLMQQLMQQQASMQNALHPQLLNMMGQTAMPMVTGMPPIMNNPISTKAPKVTRGNIWVPCIHFWNAAKRAPGSGWRFLYLFTDLIKEPLLNPLGTAKSIGVIVAVVFGGIAFVGGCTAILTRRPVTIYPPEGNVTELQQSVERSLPRYELGQ
ncbi:MAG: hypothetical protein F6J89_02005 [Symploca sp. SIO1C4]|uniref:Uncharacterized protein n=1 Tax=Symploca sp. SIO1C4 TaxID=2607765 RepID=A0A6B3N8G6_9CYAN|nr:hypothetical protein [Symploca sp. SIO1C4]